MKRTLILFLLLGFVFCLSHKALADEPRVFTIENRSSFNFLVTVRIPVTAIGNPLVTGRMGEFLVYSRSTYEWTVPTSLDDREQAEFSFLREDYGTYPDERPTRMELPLDDSVRIRNKGEEFFTFVVQSVELEKQRLYEEQQAEMYGTPMTEEDIQEQFQDAVDEVGKTETE